MTNKQTPVQTKKRFNVTKTISFGLWTLCAVGIGYSLKSTKIFGFPHNVKKCSGAGQ